LRFIDGQGPALEGGPVHFGHGLFGPGIHLYETETAAAAGLSVHDHLRSRHGAVSRKGLTELIRGTRKWQVSNIQILRHDLQTASLENEAPPHRLSDSRQNAANCEEATAPAT
jgi:hypothetical protein